MDDSIVWHPTLMRGELVAETLAGRKRATRRVVTPRTSLIDGHPTSAATWASLDWSAPVYTDPGPSPMGNPGPYLKVANVDGERRHRVYPRVQVGDRLWIRETWASLDAQCMRERDRSRVFYRADDPTTYPTDGRWRSSMMMPRWACRLVVKVLEVRPERVQEITDDGAREEGVAACKWPSDQPLTGGSGFVGDGRHRAGFAILWDELNADRGFGWSENPWVWVYRYQVDTDRGESAQPYARAAT